MKWFLIALSMFLFLSSSAPAPQVAYDAPDTYIEETLVEATPHLTYVPDVFYDFVKAACVDYGVPFKYFAKLLYVESRYDPLCTSGPNSNGTYDLGIAQLNSQYIEEFAWRYGFGTIDPFNPLQAIRVAAKHLSVLYKHTGDWRTAIAGYNAGLSRALSGDWPARTVEYVNMIFEEGV